ncbi:MAG: GNAT family N-acetyltransferase [Chloroflexota bacterium]
MDIEPVTLAGKRVRLEPLRMEHAVPLAGIATDEEIWRYLPVAFTNEDTVRGWIEASLRTAAGGSEVPFVIIETANNRPIGSTRFMDIRRPNRAVEIGWTWLGRRWWRSNINTECKYLLLRHLFDTKGCIRVTLKTDLLNQRSQRAIERLGATREGVLRKHMIVRDGRIRDSVYYSILDDEWPAIRERMEQGLAMNRA